jgi:polyisoprenoid-binding protein YceI
MKSIRSALLIPLLAVTATAQVPEQLVVDPAATSITIRVGRSGLFSFAGHDHEILAPVLQGAVALVRSDVSRSTMSVAFDAHALKVSGKGEPPQDVAEVQRVMLSDRVLDPDKYPRITFQSRSMSIDQRSGERVTLRVTGDLTLHGVTKQTAFPLTVQLTDDGLHAEGKTTIRQRDFGIEPVTAGAGTVRVKDDVEIVFAVTARRP